MCVEEDIKEVVREIKASYSSSDDSCLKADIEEFIAEIKGDQVRRFF